MLTSAVLHSIKTQALVRSSVRCWRNSVHAFSGLLAVTGWEQEFLRSSELGIDLLPSRALNHSDGVQTWVWPRMFLGQLFDLNTDILNSEVGRPLCLQSLNAISWSSEFPELQFCDQFWWYLSLPLWEEKRLAGPFRLWAAPQHPWTIFLHILCR